MSTASEQGRKFEKNYQDYCAEYALDSNPETLRKWDEEMNLSRFRKLYADDDAVFEAGLDTVYSRIFYNYTRLTFKRPDGNGTIAVQPYRKVGPGVGNTGDITSPTITKDQRDYVRDKAEREFDTATQRLLLLQMTSKQIVARVVAIAGEV